MSSDSKLHLLALKTYEKYAKDSDNGLSKAGITELMTAIRGNEELADEVVSEAARSALYYAQRTCRAQVQNRQPAAYHMPKVYSEQLRKSVLFAVGSYLNFPLMSGVKLQLAKRKELIDDADKRDRTAAGHQRTARFLREVAKSLPTDDIPVNQVFKTDESVALVMARVEEEIAKENGTNTNDVPT